MTAGQPLTVYPISGIPEVHPDDDLTALILQALAGQGLSVEDGDIFVVAQKVVSKAEGARVALNTITPSEMAERWAREWGRDPRAVELVFRESRRLVRMQRGLIVAETLHGFVCANAGLDQSNTGGKEIAILLPRDPDASAKRMVEGVRAATGKRTGAIVADTFGRPWRVGLAQVALGVAGILPLIDHIDQVDDDGRPMAMTVIAAADQLACAADLVCGKTRRVPAALIRGYDGPRGEGSGRELLRDPALDLFR